MSTNEEEKQRVIEASNYALMNLRAAKADLDSAYRWGIADVIGGMYLISGIKLAKIESAKKHIRDAMIWLQQFRRDADPTDYVNQQYMRLGFLGSALDFGIDGLITDLYAQARIDGLRRRVKIAIMALETIMKDNGIEEYRA